MHLLFLQPLTITDILQIQIYIFIDMSNTKLTLLFTYFTIVSCHPWLYRSFIKSDKITPMMSSWLSELGLEDETKLEMWSLKDVGRVGLIKRCCWY